jgi:hypothetical protein
MHCKSADLLSGCEIPQFNGVVITTTDKGFAIRADGDGINRPNRLCKGADLLSGGEIPQFDGTVTTTANKGFAISAI